MFVAEDPRFRISIVLTYFPTVTARLRGEYPNMFELLYEIEQYIGSDNVLPNRFFLVDTRDSTVLN